MTNTITITATPATTEIVNGVEMKSFTMLAFVSTAEDYMVQSKDRFGEHGFVIRLCKGEWELRII